MFSCRNGQLIEARDLCDQWRDCEDNSDEEDCEDKGEQSKKYEMLVNPFLQKETITLVKERQHFQVKCHCTGGRVKNRFLLGKGTYCRGPSGRSSSA